MRKKEWDWEKCTWQRKKEKENKHTNKMEEKQDASYILPTSPAFEQPTNNDITPAPPLNNGIPAHWRKHSCDSSCATIKLIAISTIFIEKITKQKKICTWPEHTITDLFLTYFRPSLSDALSPAISKPTSLITSFICTAALKWPSPLSTATFSSPLPPWWGGKRGNDECNPISKKSEIVRWVSHHLRGVSSALWQVSLFSSFSSSPAAGLKVCRGVVKAAKYCCILQRFGGWN